MSDFNDIPVDIDSDSKMERVTPEEWNPKLLRILWILLLSLCGTALAAEFFVHTHPHFEGTGFFGFNALLGFVSCSLMILAAKLLGVFLKRKPDYYDKDD